MSETVKKKQRAEWVLSLLEPTFEQDVKELKAHERARMYLDMIEYVQPKLARTEISGDKDNPLLVQSVNFNIVDDSDNA